MALSRTGKQGSYRNAQAKAKVIFQRDELPCRAHPRATNGTGNVQQQACHKQLIVGAASKEKRVAPVDRRPRLTGCSSEGKISPARVHYEVFRDCR